MPLTCLRAMSLQVKLDLADKATARTLPPGLRPYVERVYVRATTYKQLRALGNRLSGVPSAAALELELSFGKNEDLHLDTVRTTFRRAGLTERVRAVKYCCRSVSWHQRSFPAVKRLCLQSSGLPTRLSACSLLGQPFHHSLVELQITVWDPEQALHSLKYALRGRDRICGTLRCLQVDYANKGRPGCRCRCMSLQSFWPVSSCHAWCT